ncbi:MAG: ribosome assembly factor SBDS [Nanoarchaeota archaeon]|nr:ribosome assembly factor SBDS [Nanoarchaeota archaeon]
MQGNIEHEKIHLNLARIKKQGENFEFPVDPDLAIAHKKGEDIDLREVIKSEHIFTDAKKGLLASEEKLKEIFGTSETLEVAEQIIQKGEIQLTSEYRAKLIEDKRKQIINYIQQNGFNPSTGLPHPVTRIESALEEVKVKIDEHKSAKEQVEEIVKKIRVVLPISTEKRNIEITIPAEFTGKCYSIIQNMSTVKNENWNSDGSLTAVVEISAGLQAELFDKLNAVTHGNIQTKTIKN